MSKVLKLNRNYEIELTVTIPANGNNWFVIEQVEQISNLLKQRIW